MVCEFDSFAQPRKYDIDNVDIFLRENKLNIDLNLFHYLM